jgi:hypothetical protein
MSLETFLLLKRGVAAWILALFTNTCQVIKARKPQRYKEHKESFF